MTLNKNAIKHVLYFWAVWLSLISSAATAIGLTILGNQYFVSLGIEMLFLPVIGIISYLVYQQDVRKEEKKIQEVKRKLMGSQTTGDANNTLNVRVIEYYP